MIISWDFMAIFGLIGEHNSELALKKYGISHGD